MDPMPRPGSWFQSFLKKEPISGQGWDELCFALYPIPGPGWYVQKSIKDCTTTCVWVQVINPSFASKTT